MLTWKGALGFLLICIVPTAGLCESKKVTLTLRNETPEVQVVATVEAFGQGTQSFSTTDGNKLEYKFPVSEEDWFNTVDVRLVWPQAVVRSDGSRGNSDQLISLRIRRDFPPNFEIPISFSNKRSGQEMDRLEGLKRRKDRQFELFFRGWQIADYYRRALGAKDPSTKRAVRIFYYSAVQLASTPDYFVVMSEDAENFARDSLANDEFDDDNAFSELARKTRSFYWTDVGRIDHYVEIGDCKTARLLLRLFNGLKDSKPDEFKLQFKDNLDVLNQKAIMIDAKCGKIQGAAAPTPERVYVKYRGDVPLQSFDCKDVEGAAVVKRVCYDAPKQYMIISLRGVYYHYCTIDQGTVTELLNATSKDQFYVDRIRGHFDCRVHPPPVY